MPDPIIVVTGGPIAPAAQRKNILQVIQEVCKVVGLAVPGAVFSSTDREHVELQQIANEMAQRIAFDTHDWTRLKVSGAFTGDGTAEAFDYPEDYKRMLRTTSFWPSSSANSPLMHYPNTDDWLAMESGGGPWGNGAWTMIGDQIYIKPVLASGRTVSFFYLSSLIVIDELDNLKSEFTDDTDAFRLDNRVLRHGIIWQWKQLKGFPYAEDMTTYEEALAYMIGADRGSNIIGSSRSRTMNVTTAYPWPLGS